MVTDHTTELSLKSINEGLVARMNGDVRPCSHDGLIINKVQAIKSTTIKG